MLKRDCCVGCRTGVLIWIGVLIGIGVLIEGLVC